MCSSGNDYLETCQATAASLSPSAVEWELSVASTPRRSRKDGADVRDTTLHTVCRRASKALYCSVGGNWPAKSPLLTRRSVCGERDKPQRARASADIYS